MGPGHSHVSRSSARYDEHALARILILDDDTTLLDVLSLAFEDAGHQVVTGRDGIEGALAAKSSRFDLILSDVNMPRLDGFALCRQLRQAGDAVPIILLTSRDTEIDEALGLELGADDFVTKPFSTRILLARVAALLRREEARGAGKSASPAIRAGKLTLDPDRLRVEYAGVEVAVTVTEFRLLEVLARRPGVVSSRARLLELVRGDDSVVVDRIIDTYVRRLRRKFEAIDAAFDGIDTVVGAGYRWRSDG